MRNEQTMQAGPQADKPGAIPDAMNILIIELDELGKKLDRLEQKLLPVRFIVKSDSQTEPNDVAPPSSELTRIINDRIEQIRFYSRRIWDLTEQVEL